MTSLLPDGVYLGLDAEDYFPQGLGSSDLSALHHKREGWWWSSPHNPRAKPRDRRALTYGSALHAIMLEGVAAYEASYAVLPDKADYGDDLLTTIPEMRAALAGAGFDLTGTSKYVAADWAKAMRQNMPNVPVWPNIIEDFTHLRLAHRVAISAEDDWAVRYMRDVALDGSNEVRDLFTATEAEPPLAEVSILYTPEDGGPRRRWRIDRMFPAFDLDLKSLGNWTGRPLPWAVGDQIARFAMDMQRADYTEGRRAAYRLIAQGRLYGGSPEQHRWLRRWPEAFPTWDWVWLFYQKPDAVGGRAPVVFPVRDCEGSDLQRYGAIKCRAALDFYAAKVAEFGLDNPWSRIERLHWTDEGYDPRVFLPHWIAAVTPEEEAAYSASIGS